MKQIDSIAGKCYIATAPNGGTVTDEAGRTLATVEAGEQKAVWGTDGKLYLSDDDGKLVLATFNHALAALGLLGGGADKLPAGYTRVEFLESTGTQWITSLTPGSNERGARAIYSHSSSQSWHVGWAFCAFAGDSYIAEIFGAFRVNIGSSSPFHYGWKGLAQLVVGEEVIAANTIYQVSLNFKNDMKIKLQTPTDVYEGNLASPAKQTAEPVHVAGIANVSQKLIGHIYLYEETKGAEIVHSMSPALDPTGTPCMFDIVTHKPFYNSGTGQFIAGMTLAQVRGLRLPAVGGKLTLSLPHEASIDKQAQAALERARANGWELTLQYAEAEFPAGYRKLDFLESTGTQYIDTGYVPDNESGILLDQEKLGLGDFVPMGCRNDASSGTRFYALRSTSDAEGVSTGYGWGTWTALDRITGRQKTKLNYLNSRKVEGEQTVSLPELPFVPNQPIYMFAVNIAGEPSLLWTGRIYEAAISEGEAAAMSFVPCIAPDGKLGMYNRVDGTLKENAGSGAFIAGLATVDDVRKLWLPETGGELTVSVPSDTPDSAVEQLRANNPSWQIAIQYRTDNEN